MIALPLLNRKQCSTFSTWRGDPITSTQYYYDTAQDWWKIKSGKLPSVIDGKKVIGKFDIEDWNDMSEADRQMEIEEWEKIMSLVFHGISLPRLSVEEIHDHRLKKQAEAEQMARDMEAHKRKLEQDIAEAEDLERHYDANEIFGAF